MYSWNVVIIIWSKWLHTPVIFKHKAVIKSLIGGKQNKSKQEVNNDTSEKITSRDGRTVQHSVCMCNQGKRLCVLEIHFSRSSLWRWHLTEGMAILKKLAQEKSDVWDNYLSAKLFTYRKKNVTHLHNTSSLYIQ